MAAFESPRALHLADPQLREHADEDEHRKHIDEQRVPALMAEPRQRRMRVHHADQRDQDRRRQHEEAPEDEGVHEAGTEPLQQLALTEHDRHLVADAARHVTRALDRLGRAHQPAQQLDAAHEQGGAEREGDGEGYGCDG